MNAHINPTIAGILNRFAFQAAEIANDCASASKGGAEVSALNGEPGAAPSKSEGITYYGGYLTIKDLRTSRETNGIGIANRESVEA